MAMSPSKDPSFQIQSDLELQSFLLTTTTAAATTAAAASSSSAAASFISGG